MICRWFGFFLFCIWVLECIDGEVQPGLGSGTAGCDVTRAKQYTQLRHRNQMLHHAVQWSFVPPFCGSVQLTCAGVLDLRYGSGLAGTTLRCRPATSASCTRTEKRMSGEVCWGSGLELEVCKYGLIMRRRDEGIGSRRRCQHSLRRPGRAFSGAARNSSTRHT